jgi:hypothetical protein
VAIEGGAPSLAETTAQDCADPEVELHEPLVVEQDEPSVPKLRAMMQELLREAERAELQLAYKLLKALLR